MVTAADDTPTPPRSEGPGAFAPRAPRTGLLLLLIGVLGAASIVYVYGTKLHYPAIRSDGIGYYLYLPSFVIHRDPSMRETARRSFDGEIPFWTGATFYPPTNSYVDKFPIGVALLETPFFLAGHAAALASGAPADGFSPPYQFAVAFGGLCYLLGGLYFLAATLARTFSAATVALTLVFITFGTNLFHYGTLDNSFSHVYSFFLIACFLRAVDRWHGAPSPAATVWVAAAAALITLVRPTNSLVFVYFFLHGVRDLDGLRRRAADFARRPGLLALGCAVYAALLVPQMAYATAVTGRWSIFSYREAAVLFDFWTPQFLKVLFTVRKGLFFWSPLLLLATAGLFLLRRYKPEWVLPTLVYLPANLYVISSWVAWAYGGSFGHRAFTESLPVFALGYASLVEAAGGRRARAALLALSALFTIYSLAQMWKYWVGVIPFDETTWEIFSRTLFQFKR